MIEIDAVYIKNSMLSTSYLNKELFRLCLNFFPKDV